MMILRKSDFHVSPLPSEKLNVLLWGMQEASAAILINYNISYNVGCYSQHTHVQIKTPLFFFSLLVIVSTTCFAAPAATVLPSGREGVKLASLLLCQGHPRRQYYPYRKDGAPLLILLVLTSSAAFCHSFPSPGFVPSAHDECQAT